MIAFVLKGQLYLKDMNVLFFPSYMGYFVTPNFLNYL